MVVVGQDGLSDGTPVGVLNAEGVAAPPAGEPVTARDWGGGQGMRRLDLANATPEQIERFKAMMKSRGLSDEEIEQRLERMRAQ